MAAERVPEPLIKRGGVAVEHFTTWAPLIKCQERDLSNDVFKFIWGLNLSFFGLYIIHWYGQIGAYVYFECSYLILLVIVTIT